MSRYITEGRQVQGRNEAVAYRHDTTPWGGTPTSVSVAAYSVNIDGTYTDVTATVFPVNSPTVAGNVISTSLLRNLTAGTLYRVEVRFTSGGNVLEAVQMVLAER